MAEQGKPIVTAVIMAGGRGERFWPRSRSHTPKQFLSLTGDGETMLQKTVKRLEGLVQHEHIYVVTNAEHLALAKQQLPELPQANLLAEPISRNTAPCIALAAAVIRKRHGDAVMLVLPADHIIRHRSLCRDVLQKAIDAAARGAHLVTVGITPTYPETGYGYIGFTQEEAAIGGVYRVAAFCEKPDTETAKTYVRSGRYLWNSGMFAWRTSVYCNALRAHLPVVADFADRITAVCDTPQLQAVLVEAFPKLPSVSVDYGLLEKSDQLYTIPAGFGWDDVGSWPALGRVAKTDTNGNYRSGDIMTVGTKNCVFYGGKRLIAAVGLENIVLVDTDDALLACSVEQAQNVRKITEMLREQGRADLL